MILNRRSFLAALGIGAGAVVVPDLVLEPRRRIWQVPRNAPVGLSAAGHTVNVVSSPSTMVFPAHDLRAGDLVAIDEDGYAVRAADYPGRTVIGVAASDSSASQCDVQIGIDRAPNPNRFDFLGEHPEMRDWLGPKAQPFATIDKRELDLACERLLANCILGPQLASDTQSLEARANPQFPPGYSFRVKV